MSDIEKILEMMGRAPDPAGEVVVLDRAVVVQLLADREHKGPLDPLVTYLRGQLDLPKVELWAMHSVGPGEIYPALNLEHAEKMLAGLRKCEQREKQRLIDSNDPSLKYWCDWVVNIIPSPYEPEEHFRELAEQSIEEAERFRAGWIEEEQSNKGLKEQHARDSAALRSLCQARDDARKERDQLKRDNASLRGSCAKLGLQHAGMVRAVRKNSSEIANLKAENNSEVNACLLSVAENKKLKADSDELKSQLLRADQIICDESKDAAFARAKVCFLEQDIEKLKAENEALRKDACRYRWLRANEFDIGSYHPEGEYNHKSWFENFDDESIDLAISYESEFAAEAMGSGEQP